MLIIPRTAVLLAGRAVEVPSVDYINFEKSKFEEQLWQADRKKMDQYWRENPPTPNESREQRMTQFRRFMTELASTREEEERTFAEKLNEDRRNKESRQQQVALSIARISPTSSFSLASADLAGTSLELKQRFQETANAYQVTYSNFINEKTDGMGGGWWARGGDDTQSDPIDPYELPAYNFEEPPASELVSGALPDMAILVFFNLIFFVGAFVAFLRYDVR